MKKSLRNVLCCGAILCTFTLASCGSNPSDVKKIEIIGGENTSEQYKDYNYDNLSLQITKKDGSVETVKITDNMIKQRIDSSKEGQQKIVVSYDGKDYVLTVKVESSPVNAFYSKIQGVITDISTSVKDAKSVTIRVKANEGASYFEDKYGVFKVDSENSNDGKFEYEFTFTKEQVENGEMLNTLAGLQLSIDRGAIVTKGDEVYATIDAGQFLNHIFNLVLSNRNTIKQSLLPLAFEKANKEFTKENGLVYDFAITLLDGVYTGANFETLIQNIFSDNLIDYISTYSATSIAERFGVDGDITPLKTCISKVIKDIVTGNNVASRQNLNNLIVAYGVFVGADVEKLENALANFDSETKFYESAVNVLDGFNLLNVNSVVYDEESGILITEKDEELTDNYLGALTALAKELDARINGEDSNMFTALVDLIKTEVDALNIAAYKTNVEFAKLVGEDTTELIYEPNKDTELIFAKFKDLAVEIDNALNGKQSSVSSKIVALVDVITKTMADNEELDEKTVFIVKLFNEYFKPQLTAEVLDGFAGLVVNASSMSPLEIQEVIKNAVRDFANNEKTMAFVNLVVTNVLVNNLGEDLIRDEQGVIANQYAIFDENGQLQEYIAQIRDLICDIIYGKTDLNLGFGDIRKIAEDNNFDSMFNSFENTIVSLDNVIKGLINDEVSMEQMQTLEMVAYEILGLELKDLDSEDEDEIREYNSNALKELDGFIVDVKSAINSYYQEQDPVQFISTILSSATKVYSSNYFYFSPKKAQLTYLFDGILKSYISTEGQNIELCTNLTTSFLAIDADDSEVLGDGIVVGDVKDVIISIANLFDHMIEYDAEEMKVKISEIVGKPGFAKTISMLSDFDMPYPIYQIGQALLTFAFQSEDVNYNKILSVVKEQIAEKYVDVDFNKVVDFAKVLVDEVANAIQNGGSILSIIPICSNLYNNEHTQDLVLDLVQKVVVKSFDNSTIDGNGNEYAVFDENGKVQQYLIDYATTVADMIFGKVSLDDGFETLHQIMDDNNFSDKFNDAGSMLSQVETFKKVLLDAEVTDEDKQTVAMMLSYAIGVNVVLPENATYEDINAIWSSVTQKMLGIVDSIRSITTGESIDINAVLDGILDVYNDENVSVDDKNVVIVTYIKNVYNSFMTTFDPQLVTNLVKAFEMQELKYFEGEEEIANIQSQFEVLYKISYILDNANNLSKEEMVSNFIELVNLNRFADVVSSIGIEKSYVQIAQALLDLVFDVPADFNELLSEIKPNLRDGWDKVDLNVLKDSVTGVVTELAGLILNANDLSIEQIKQALANIESNLSDDGLNGKFDSVVDGLSAINTIARVLTDETINATDKQYFVGLIGTVFGLEVTDIAGMTDIENYVDEFRSILFKDEFNNVEKLYNITKLTDELFDSENLEVSNKGMVFLFSFASGLLNDYIVSGDAAENLLTNYLESSFKAFSEENFVSEKAEIEFNQRNDALLKMAYIIDNTDDLSEIEIATNLIQLISMPGFTPVVAEITNQPEYVIQTIKAFAYLVIDVPGVDYNELLSGLAEVLPKEWENVDFNELVSYIRNTSLQDAIKINDVRVDLIEGQDNKVIGQKSVFLAEFNLDLLVAKAHADFTFEVEVAY